MCLYNKRIFRRCFDNKGKYWYNNIKEIPLYFSQIRHLMKNGYEDEATFNTQGWFIETMTSVLKKYKKVHGYYPPRMSNKEWEDIVENMIDLLSAMDESNEMYNTAYYNDINFGLDRLERDLHKARDEFFELFRRYFYTF